MRSAIRRGVRLPSEPGILSARFDSVVERPSRDALVPPTTLRLRFTVVPTQDSVNAVTDLEITDLGHAGMFGADELCLVPQVTRWQMRPSKKGVYLSSEGRKEVYIKLSELYANIVQSTGVGTVEWWKTRICCGLPGGTFLDAGQVGRVLACRGVKHPENLVALACPLAADPLLGDSRMIVFYAKKTPQTDVFCPNRFMLTNESIEAFL